MVAAREGRFASASDRVVAFSAPPFRLVCACTLRARHCQLPAALRGTRTALPPRLASASTSSLCRQHDHLQLCSWLCSNLCSNSILTWPRAAMRRVSRCAAAAVVCCLMPPPAAPRADWQPCSCWWCWLQNPMRACLQLCSRAGGRTRRLSAAPRCRHALVYKRARRASALRGAFSRPDSHLYHLCTFAAPPRWLARCR